jgi:arsenate reductase (glutaredoxin)
MAKITVYEKPTCTTCRKVVKILAEKGFEFDKIDYFIKPFTKSKLKQLLKKMNMTASELLRKNEDSYKILDIKNKSYTNEEILNLMMLNAALIQRPIVEYGDKAVLARPPEKINELF